MLVLLSFPIEQEELVEYQLLIVQQPGLDPGPDHVGIVAHASE